MPMELSMSPANATVILAVTFLLAACAQGGAGSLNPGHVGPVGPSTTGMAGGSGANPATNAGEITNSAASGRTNGPVSLGLNPSGPTGGNQTAVGASGAH